MPSRLRSLADNVVSQEHSLGHIELLVRPRPQERINLVVQQPAVEERLVLLVREVRLHDRVEEFRILLRQEHIQLVAGELRVFFLLLFRLQFRPVEEERKLGQLRIVRQRREQQINPRETVIRLELRRGDVRQRERLPGPNQTDLFLLREMFLAVQPVRQPQVDEE